MGGEGGVTPAVTESYAWCTRVARARARNFYYSFLLLDRPRRNAICAVYAFMRHCDDLSDDQSHGLNSQPQASKEALESWSHALAAALDGRFGDHPVWPALHDAVTRYRIPAAYLHAMIGGVLADLDTVHMRTFEELYSYCYRVASVVGLTIIHIFGFDQSEPRRSRALALAEKCGVAFQLTNILRDVAEDSALGRQYLPQEDLDRFGVTGLEADSPALRRLLAFEGARARAYFDDALPLVELVDPDARASLGALIEIYRRLLGRIEKAGFDVLATRHRVPTWEKIGILLRARFGFGPN